MGSVASQWATDNVHWLIQNRDQDAGTLDALKKTETWDRDLLAADIRKGDPDVILVQRGPEDWLSWARENPDIAASLDAYQPDGRYLSDGMRVGARLDIELWRRKTLRETAK